MFYFRNYARSKVFKSESLAFIPADAERITEAQYHEFIDPRTPDERDQDEHDDEVAETINSVRPF